jgi:hypothetical protein
MISNKPLENFRKFGKKNYNRSIKLLKCFCAISNSEEDETGGACSTNGGEGELV